MRRKDKFLNKIKQRSHLIFALAASSLLHLLLFTAVTIIVEPTFESTLYPKVVFLGPILNQDTVSSVSLTHKLSVPPKVASYSFRRKPVRIIKRVSFFRFQRKLVGNERSKIPTLFSSRIVKGVNIQTILSKSGEQVKYPRRDSAQIFLNSFQRSLIKLENMLIGDDNSPKLSAQANALYFPKRLKKVTFLRIRAKKRVSSKPSTFESLEANEKYLHRRLRLSEITYKSKSLYFPKQSKKEFESAANIFWNSPYRRGVLYEPPLPEDHLQDGRARGDFNLEFDFLVSPQGRIVSVKKLTSSGFSEIDAQAIRYLKKWRFAPSSREQWGRIKLNFKLR